MQANGCLPYSNEVLYLSIYGCCILSAQFRSRAFTGSTLSPMAGLVDLEGCSRGVTRHHPYNLLHQANPPVMPLRTSPVQISIHLDSRDPHQPHKERHLILMLHHSHSHLPALSRTLPHVRLRHLWPLLDPIMPPQVLYHPHLALTLLITLVGAQCPVMAIRLIQQAAHLQLLPHRHRYLLWMNYWK